MKVTFKRKIQVVLVFVAVLVLFAGCGLKKENNKNGDNLETSGKSDAEKLTVYASVYPMYDFTKKVGGDKVNVICMVPSGVEPHDWEPTPADIVNLGKADLFIYNGAGMEHWIEKVLGSLNNKKLIVVEASKGLALIDNNINNNEGKVEENKQNSNKDNVKSLGQNHKEDIDHDEENDYDPHVWLSPLNAKKEMENIKNALIEADPENKEYYKENYEKYAAEFDALDNEFRETISTLPNKDIIVTHKAFGYLCLEYGLNQVAIEGLSPDYEPDPARMAEIIEFAREHGVKVIFFEEQANSKVADTIAKAINAKTDVLNPLDRLSDARLKAGEDYFSAMRQNLNAIREALK